MSLIIYTSVRWTQVCVCVCVSCLLLLHASICCLDLYTLISLSLSHIHTHINTVFFGVGGGRAVRGDFFWKVPKQAEIFLPGRCQARNCATGWGDVWHAYLSFLKLFLDTKNEIRGILKQDKLLFSQRKYWMSTVLNSELCLTLLKVIIRNASKNALFLQ